MPNDRTNLHTYVSEHKNELMGNADSNSSESFKAYISQLEKLVVKMDSLYQLKNGQCPDVTEADLKSVLALYDSTQKACAAYIQTGAANDGPASVINVLLQKDMQMLRGFKAEKGVSFPDMLKRARGLEIEVNAADLKPVGGAVSTRIPVSYVDENGQEVQGFFTKDVTYYDDQNEMLRAAWVSMKKEYPELSFLIDYDAGNLSLAGTNLLESYGQVIRNPDPTTFKNHFDAIMTALGRNNDPNYSQIFEQAKEMTKKCQKSIDPHLSHFRDYQSTQRFSSGSTINGRNVGMSVMADLLGCGEVIARSQPMTMVINGQRITGTFMANAEGKPCKKLSKSNPLLQVNPNLDQIVTRRAVRQLSTLQALDYICYNMDRHIHNMTFQFSDESEFDSIEGIQGIDNDLSFGTNTFAITLSWRMGDPNEFVILPESLCKRIQQLQKAELSAALCHVGISAAEINAVWERLKIVQ